MSSNNIPRTALITGAGRRIGRAVALDLAKDGWAVAIHYNKAADEALSLAVEIKDSGGKSALVKADLSQENELADIVKQSVEALGPVGCLINNASTFEYDTVETATRASWDLHMEANLRAPFVLIQSFAAQLPPDAQGVVVNMIDQRVWNLTPHFTTYTLSKVGLWTLTQTLAMALAPRIRINAIGPGPALPSARQTNSQFAEQCGRMPLKRGTSPNEICRAIRFIIDAPSMTGQMIALDGGQHLGWAHDAVESKE